MVVKAEDLTPEVFPEDAQLRRRIFQRQSELTTQDRAATHGSPNRCFQYIADRWNLYLHHTLGLPLDTLSAYDVTRLMVELKLGRADAGERQNPEHLGDAIGYAGLAVDLEGFVPPQD